MNAGLSLKQRTTKKASASSLKTEIFHPTRYWINMMRPWSGDAKIAFKAMKKGEEGIMDALQNHLVGIEGELHSFTWFGAAMKFVTQ